MKKVFLVGLVGLSVAQAASALMPQAFPSDGFTDCTAGRGKLNFGIIAQIEQMPGGAQLVNNKVNSAVMKCVQGNEPKFKANLQAACKQASLVNPAIVSTTMDKLCGTQSVVVDPNVQPVVATEVDPNTPAVVTGTVVDTKALMVKAFPTGGFGSCAAPKGNLDFNAISQLEVAQDPKLPLNAMSITQCATPSNPNFNSSLTAACQRPAADSNTRTRLCGLVGISASAATTIASTNPAVLIAQAFPSGGFGDCAAEKGLIKFDVVAKLEAMTDPTAATLLNNKLPTVKACNTPSNPNFQASLGKACTAASSVASPTKDQLCGAMTSSIQAKKVGGDIKAMMTQAFPSTGLTTCSKEKGALNFPIISQIEQLPGGADQVSKKITADVLPCTKGNDPNYMASLQLACNAPTDFPSPTKDQLCGTTSAAAGAANMPALLARAFPTSGIGSCSEGKGLLDFGAIAAIESKDPTVLSQGKANVTQCIQGNNPNFVSSLRKACSMPSQPSTTKTGLCQLIGATVGLAGAGSGTSSADIETRLAALEAKVQNIIDNIQNKVVPYLDGLYKAVSAPQ